MIATCREKLVGQVMATSISINGLDMSNPHYPQIMKRFEIEIERVRRIFAKELAAQYEANPPHYAPPDPNPVSELPSDETAKRRILDHTVMCSVLCCCNESPNAGAAGQELKQGCVHDVFQEADKALDWQSRYKSELSWNMRRNEPGATPTPFMHRDTNGNDTTERSHYWQARLGEVVDYQPSQGDVRRPDMCMPADPSRPPNPVDNMDAVVEVKFGDDPPDYEQDRAYTRIAGDKEKYFKYRCGGQLRDGEIGCDCNDPGWPAP